MLRGIIVLFLVFCPKIFFGQNLILNHSFEDTTLVQVQSINYIFPKYWRIPTNGSTDYYSNIYGDPNLAVPQNFAGYQFPDEGESYIGLVIYSLYTNSILKRAREYIQTEFRDTLKKDSVYCMQIHANLPDSIWYGSRNQLAAYLSTNEVSSNDQFNLPFSPQIIISPTEYISDKHGWMEFNIEYTASGGERYITIGNFNDSNLVDTTFLGGGNELELTYQGTYYFIDNIYFGKCDSLPTDTSIGIVEFKYRNNTKIFPNPSKESFKVLNDEKVEVVQIFNPNGRLILEYAQDSSYKLPEESGLYFVRIYFSDGSVHHSKVIRE